MAIQTICRNDFEKIPKPVWDINAHWSDHLWNKTSAGEFCNVCYKNAKVRKPIYSFYSSFKVQYLKKSFT